MQNDQRGALPPPQPPGAAAPGVVVFHPCRPHRHPGGHESETQRRLAQALAEIRGWDYGGEFDPACRYDRPLYFVPSDTLESIDDARRLGIRDEHDLFGGVVPRPFVGGKTITHGLPEPGSVAPEGWEPGFAREVAEVVLPGYSVFAHRDAELAARRLLQEGSVRLKKASGIGGCGQSVVADEQALAARLAEMDADELRRDGLVLERNLREVVTYGIGQVRVGTLQASYFGTQRLTRNNRGDEVYGGSSLTIVRGDFDALLRLPLPPGVDTAIAQACRYHRAALASFPGLFASRCNYDVAQGVDDAGRWRSGVLEQSWRIGGASGAEIAALQAFRADPALGVVCASTTEVYGESPALPDDAQVLFSGHDARVGPITKYSRLEPYAHPG